LRFSTKPKKHILFFNILTKLCELKKSRANASIPITEIKLDFKLALINGFSMKEI